jgi:hypothetical protein
MIDGDSELKKIASTIYWTVTSVVTDSKHTNIVSGLFNIVGGNINSVKNPLSEFVLSYKFK